MSLEYQLNYNAHVINLSNKYEIKKQLSEVQVDKRAHELLLQNLEFMHIKLTQVDTRAANIIKKEISRLGGTAGISKEAYSYTARNTDVIIGASKKNFYVLIRRLGSRQYGLDRIAKEIEKCLINTSGVMTIGKKVFDFNHNTYIVGGMDFHKNLFSSRLNEKNVLKKVEQLLTAGADIIEMCGENLEKLHFNKEIEGDEIKKIVPLIHRIKSEFPELPLSVDTCRYNVAKATLDAGVDMINEVIPLKYNQEMISLIAKFKVPVVIMYNPNFNKTPKPLSSISDVIRDIQSNVFYAESNGVEKDKIIIDPGIGFGKSDKDNFLILRQLSTFNNLRYPVLVGMSRQSFLGSALKGEMARTTISSIATNTIAIINGANIVRIHDHRQIEVMRNVIHALKRAED